jgi:predicted GIY-YIG superfamily endonuclease
MASGIQGTIYLIHMDSPVSDAHTTQHYLGWASDLDKRIQAHAKGAGARLMEVCKERKIGWQVVRTWENATRDDERRLKNRKEGPRLCPVCVAAGRTRKRPDC